MQKVNSIQYLRAIAALMVVTYHSSIRAGESISPAVLDFLKAGSAGVDLFFVISGFIMWTIADQRPTTPGVFLQRRITRIAPIYWLATLGWLALAVIAPLSWVKATPDHIWQSLFFIPHFSPSYPGEVYPLLVPGWTLNYEMFFYVIFACCLFLPKERRLAALASVLGALAAAGLFIRTDNAVLLTYTNPLLLEFLAGAFAGFLWAKGVLPRGATAAALLVMGVAGMALSRAVDLDEENYRVLLWGAPAVMIVVGALGLSFFAKRNRFLLAIGDASYSLYLSHVIVLTFLTPAWEKFVSLSPSPFAAAAFIAAGLFFSSAAGLVLFRFVERPLEAYFRSAMRVTPQTALARRREAG